jgi:hypothetical protein
VRALCEPSLSGARMFHGAPYTGMAKFLAVKVASTVISQTGMSITRAPRLTSRQWRIAVPDVPQACPLPTETIHNPVWP